MARRAALTLGLLGRLGVRPPARVLDAGCGWGVTLEALERHGYRAAGMDISRRTLERLDRPGRRLIEADLTRPIDPAEDHYDAVLALNVIEHLDDDRAAVARLCRLARPGGLLVVSVPALAELFTEFDAIQGHRRRYVPATLRAAFADTGLEVERIFWWGRWLVPAHCAGNARGGSGKRGNRRPRSTAAISPPPLAAVLGGRAGVRPRAGPRPPRAAPYGDLALRGSPSRAPNKTRFGIPGRSATRPGSQSKPATQESD